LLTLTKKLVRNLTVKNHFIIVKLPINNEDKYKKLKSLWETLRVPGTLCQ